MTLEIDVDKKGMQYSVAQIEKALKIKGLREVDLKEYNKLSKLYCA